MQGLVDVGRMGCSSLAALYSSLAALSIDIHNQKRLFATVNLSLLHFTQDIQA
jgi:hypothetical protein